MRPEIHRPRLLRLLDAWTPSEAPRRDLAERLSGWLGVREAIALQQTQARIIAIGREPRAEAALPDTEVLSAELQRLRAALEQTIRNDDLAPLRAAAPDPAPWHHRYLQHQRRMADSTATLRNRLRQQLGDASPRLSQLCALDAAMEQLMGRREQQLLGSVPSQLRKRFADLQAEHEAQCRQLFPPPAQAWVDAFERDFRETLLAELELRLQPALGLIDACREEEALVA